MDERQLIERAVAGDPVAERAIYEQHVGRVYRMACRMTGNETLAEDFTQEVFVRAFDRLGEFRFQSRVWYLKNTSTICAGCSRGCNIVVGVLGAVVGGWVDQVLSRFVDLIMSIPTLIFALVILAVLLAACTAGSISPSIRAPISSSISARPRSAPEITRRKASVGSSTTRVSFTIAGARHRGRGSCRSSAGRRR